MIKNEAVKALPIRLVRGGNYGEWAEDADVADVGITEMGRSNESTKRLTELN